MISEIDWGNIMDNFQPALIRLQDRYNPEKYCNVRVKYDVLGVAYISRRQFSDACRRSGMISGSYLVFSSGSYDGSIIEVVDSSDRLVDVISRARA